MRVNREEKSHAESHPDCTNRHIPEQMKREEEKNTKLSVSSLLIKRLSLYNNFTQDKKVTSLFPAYGNLINKDVITILQFARETKHPAQQIPATRLITNICWFNFQASTYNSPKSWIPAKAFDENSERTGLSLRTLKITDYFYAHNNFQIRFN